jgi:hypothetical protein
MALTKAQKEAILDCAYRAPKESKKIDCNRGCCERRLTKIYECLKHGPDKFVTMGSCEDEKTVVAACIYCTMAKTKESMTPDELAELERLKSNHPGFC